MAECEHRKLLYEPSQHAAEVGYIQPSEAKRRAATQPSGRDNSKAGIWLDGGSNGSTTFPAPLVLPGDDLSYDPTYPAQSLRSWILEKDRNEVTPDRRTVYVVWPPTINREVKYLYDWTTPTHAGAEHHGTSPPPHEEILKYLQAFYYGLSVKKYKAANLQFRPWNAETTTHSSHEIGLECNGTIYSIRTRTQPDEALFTAQLNLNDLLDAAIGILPDDAYTLLMLAPYDLYEDEEDDFCCGRAYGGSRVAVVSMARYNPDLDQLQGVERQHAWPASHCRDYIAACCANQDTAAIPKAAKRPTSKTSMKKTGTSPTTIRAALQASTTAHPPTDLQTVWLGRVCKTASHELGHCFGLDHCVYYACIMQGTANLVEDARQPPYLCPVDLAKVLRAVVGNSKAKDEELIEMQRKRYEALVAYCGRWTGDPMFRAFATWLRIRLGYI